jgi:N-acetylmuramoyl-L-alanine amidase
MKRISVLIVSAVVALAVNSCSTSSSALASPSGINLRHMLVPEGRCGRRIEFPLRARYITIHSTANRGATALQHGRGMAVGAFRGRTKFNRTGYITWHFTVDDREAIQHLPLGIQGEHADHDGPGNHTSIGIEICEFRDPARQAAAVDRAARLAAWLSRHKSIPVDHIVPHYHWPQRNFGNYQKPCPRILMDNGRPGPKWNAFLNKVHRYR